MKKSIIIAAISAASAILLVSSCAKEELRENVNTEDGKVFTAVINQDLTKTTITSEYKVNWVEGDQIDINGSIFSATPDASDATKATFTKVSGSDPTPGYTAVYPANIIVSTQPTLPATQTYAAGKFNAPMCAMSSTETLEFKNFCGVLCFALKGTDKVKSIAVTANEQLCGPFEFSDATSIAFSGYNEGYTVTLNCGEGVQLDASTATSFYISLPPATYTTGMKIVVTSTEGKTFEKTTTKSAAIARNQIYTFNWTASFSPAEPDCVEIGGVKWATKNLGAENVTDYGDYFAWGETAPYYEGTGGWPATLTWKSGKASGYAWQSYCGSSSFSEWSTTPYDATTKILKPEFDAATQILGDGWRMPTNKDFRQLCTACGITSDIFTPTSGGSKSTTAKGVYWCEDYDGVKGLLFCDGTNKLFFPASGMVNGTSLDRQPDPWGDVCGRYWSSSRNPVTTSYAYLFYFKSMVEVNPEHTNNRFYGYSVRPVKDAAAPRPTGALKGVFSVSATKKVHFSQGNLTYDINASTNKWKFYEHQYDCATGSDSNLISLFTWGYGTWSTEPSGTGYQTGDFTDWGSQIGDGNTWRTLSKDEWTYLFNTRTVNGGKGAGKSYSLNITYGGKMGVVLYPNDYTGSVLSGTVDSLPEGVVFLPAAGYRRYGSMVSSVGESGFYWSSTACSTNAYGVNFNSYTASPGYDDNRSFGFSVRLVTEVK